MSSRCRAFLLLALSTAACVADPDAEVSPSPATDEVTQLAAAPPRSVLWIGAHPDDEAYVAPLMADLCQRLGATCHFLVLTDGGKGNCLLGPGACGVPDTGGAPPGSVGAFRLGELAAVMRSFGGHPVALALEDTPSATVLGAMQRWNQSLSRVPGDLSVELITQRVAQAITATAPELIITFDPRHGVYCHPDHRAAGALTALAVDRLGIDPSRVLMLESAELYLDAAGRVSSRAWVPADPALAPYDSHAAGTWPARAAMMSQYPSQFSSLAVQLIATAPAAARTLPFLSLAQARAASATTRAAYDQVCASQAWWDGRGTCPTATGVGPCW
jgi:LmbE family N-acetylglucosaminyl deacetylase